MISTPKVQAQVGPDIKVMGNFIKYPSWNVWCFIRVSEVLTPIESFPVMGEDKLSRKRIITHPTYSFNGTENEKDSDIF
jgi:hypothetical protein